MGASSEKFIRNNDILSTEMDGEVVMMDAEAGSYFSLSSGVGAVVWEILETPSSAQDIVRVVCQQYDVSPEQCATDVEAFMKQLKSNSLILPAQDV